MGRLMAPVLPMEITSSTEASEEWAIHANNAPINTRITTSPPKLGNTAERIPLSRSGWEAAITSRNAVSIRPNPMRTWARSRRSVSGLFL